MTSIRRHSRSFALAAALSAAASSSQPAVAADLFAQFQSPPRAARPQVWWHWMSGNVTMQGMKLDLEWLDRVGIGGVHAFSGGGFEKSFVANPLPFMSPGWREVYRTAVASAHARGMEFAIAGSPGWSETGGPWVAPTAGMKKYVWSEVTVEGGKAVGLLPKPVEVTGPFLGLTRGRGSAARAYGDSAVIAFPTPAAETTPVETTYRSNAGPIPELGSASPDLGSATRLVLPASGGVYVDVAFAPEVEVGGLILAVDPVTNFEILASDDGVQFHSIGRFSRPEAETPSPQQTYSLPRTHARVFRVSFERPPAPQPLPGLPPLAAAALGANLPKALSLRRLEFVTGARVDRWESKAGFQSTASFEAERTPMAPADALVRPSDVVDLTARMRPDGLLDWTPPPGRWTIVRLGWSLTGQTNGPAEPASTGLEVDKLDGDAVRAYVEKLFAIYHDDVGAPIGSGGITSLVTDSWEAGVQNWTPQLLAQFKRLRGYDPTPWLPVLTGRIVSDAKRSDAFLFDFRQTLKDLVVESHYAVLAKAAHRHGMNYYTEAQGDTPRAIADGLSVKAMADIPTGEFWYRPYATDPGQPPLVADLEEAASAAHLYGKPLVAAEAMTVAAGPDPWAFSPAMLKPVADEIFARGVNRILIHDSRLQPFADRRPGLMLLGFYGQFFNRNDTWADDARLWTDYLARTSYLLQQGKFVADVLYFYGEDENLTQRYQHSFNKDVPAGYAFDYVDRRALLSALSVDRDRLTTPGGMSYRVIYVPPYVGRMSLAVIERLAALVRAGAVLAGPKPVGGLGLQSPDAAVLALADQLWGPAGTVRPVGLGRVYATANLGDVLRRERIRPDTDVRGAPVMSVHRRTAQADIYFVSNRAAAAKAVQATFRVSGRIPEFWSAEDGRRQRLSFRSDGRSTTVTLPLDAQGAGFVVFREHTTLRARTIGQRRVLSTQAVGGPWTVAFQPDRGAPASVRFGGLSDWAMSQDPGVRYFSGAASYTRKLVVPRSMIGADRRLVLDLGTVRELAVVSVDGRVVGSAWHAPYRVDLTGRVGAGVHDLQIKVVNLWVNRLIGDKQPGATPVTWAPQSTYTAESRLRSSGLLGPVALVSEVDPGVR